MIASAPDIRAVWLATLGELELQMSRGNFDAWLSGSAALGYDHDDLLVAIDNPLIVTWLQKRFGPMASSALSNVSRRQLHVRFVPRPRSTASPNPVRALETTDQAEAPPPGSVLPPPEGLALPAIPAGSGRHTFANFVVGDSNRLAHAACLSVAEQPGSIYNPLFIYGGVGLGKTHLLHAIAHAAAERDVPLLYVSAESFTNDVVDGIRHQRMDALRAKYRLTRLLMIDDIQFVGGKERTEEEFFHTFNSLYEAGNQVVLTSDRPPRALTVLPERLQSRFAMGLIVDIQPPDFETRLAILRAKPHASDVPDDVLQFIAHRVQRNIRDLEGSLNRLLAYARLYRQPLTVQLASQLLQEAVLNGGGPSVPPERVLDAVTAHYGVTREELIGKARDRKIIHPRQLTMYLLREDARLSLADIGQILGRDHSTVMHGVRSVLVDIQTDSRTEPHIQAIRRLMLHPASP